MGYSNGQNKSKPVMLSSSNRRLLISIFGLLVSTFLADGLDPFDNLDLAIEVTDDYIIVPINENNNRLSGKHLRILPANTVSDGRLLL